MSIDKFFKKFDTTLPLNAISYLSKNKKTMYVEHLNTSTQSLEDYLHAAEMEALSIDKNYLVKWFGLEYISEVSRPGKYLLDRCITNFNNFLYEPKHDNLIILNLIHDKVIGFQIRKLNKNKNQSKYITVSLKKIHETLLKDEANIPENFDTMSMVFNLYNVDITRPVLATEGPIDSLFLPNCVAMLGAQKQVNLGFPLWYAFDSDETGKKATIEKLQKGFHVFLWGRLKKMYNLPERKKWDINDFVKWCRDNQKDLPRYWSTFFSHDLFDIMEV